MSAARLAVAALIVLALSGCGVLREMEAGGTEPWVESDMPPPASDLESLLLYFQHIKRLPAGELGKERDSARQTYTRTRSDFDRVRLAMVLSLPNTSFRDEPRALELLDPVARNRRASLHGLVFLLSAYIHEQKRLDGNAQSLQHKLDALKSLERSLSEREQGGAKKR